MIAGSRRIIDALYARGVSSATKEIQRNILRDKKNGKFDKIAPRPDVADLILENTEITRDHMTPELKLLLLTPNCPLYYAPLSNASDESKNGAMDIFLDPFWSIYWPGGQALARFILDEREKIFPRTRKGISVLDLGAGCGAAGIAAKLAGASRVLANDIDRVACVAILMNAALNNVDVEVSPENLLRQSKMEPYDVILIGDLLYDEGITGILIPWLEKASGKGARVYLGDPGRHGLTVGLRRRLRLIREYALPENVRKENHGYGRAAVWEFSV